MTISARLRPAALLVGATLLLLPALAAPASATAVLAGTCKEGPKAGLLTYTAEPGIANELTITQNGTTLLLEDAAGQVAGCNTLGDAAEAGPATVIRVLLGDESDAVAVNVLPQGQKLTVFGGEGDDDLLGSVNADDLRGGLGDDSIRGIEGNDMLRGDAGDDDLRGGNEADVLIGGGGDDDLSGGAGADELNGGSGEDELRGEAGTDELNGGGGPDELDGGAGTDVCNGGPGTDTATRCE
ncbi:MULTISPECIES: calcium-binding protein [unclassified Streptosporangium]|uniref:calcium-binding protein n=1 Tax=unclassified Streptosporangium TaxID=2632669 RepID=UPI002E2851CC|nr:MULTISPECIES: calcium-binding protein [unclassified Streptosporangium]